MPQDHCSTPHSTLNEERSESQKELWKQELLQSFTEISTLVEKQILSPAEAKKLESSGQENPYKIRITPYYAGLMSASSDCPIRKQAIPALGEADPLLPEWASHWSQQIYKRPNPWHADAIGDLKNLAAPRITHRYQSRAILHLSSMCAVYCRFCFRKSHLNDEERTLYEGSLEPAFQYLERSTTISELILTGGDPLSVADSAILRLLERISRISHIKTLRIHSRMAVTLPCRFTPSLLSLLGQDWNFNIILVSHYNHPRELSPEALSTLQRLKKKGVTLLNQAVLLRGVNNEATTLEALFRGLYQAGVIPFYLHHPDWTPGTFHFRVSIEEGQSILSQLRGVLPGPALPDYILDIPQGYGKVSLLDPRVRKIQHVQDSILSGALYEVPTPSTRFQNEKSHRYLDLSFRHSR